MIRKLSHKLLFSKEKFLKFDYSSIYLYTELLFTRRSIQLKNSHGHQTLLTYFYVGGSLVINCRRGGVRLQGHFVGGPRLLGGSQTAVQGVWQAAAEERQGGRSYLP